MKIEIVTYGIQREIEFTNGAYQFILHHNVTHLMKGDFILVGSNSEIVEVQANTLEELQDLAVKYNAVIGINFDRTIDIEFVSSDSI